MPELPEVETVRRTLAPCVGRRVLAVWSSGATLRDGAIPVAAIGEALVGRRIEGVRRWGKFLFLDVVGGAASLLVHLGMTGRLRLLPPPAGTATPGETGRALHTHLVMQLSGRPVRELCFSDPRRFGVVSMAWRGEERRHPALASLGRDPLLEPIDGPALHAMTRGVRRAIKVFLLDQRHIAGVGNIYASEALWQARIRPTCPAGSLSRPRAAMLAASIAEVLHRALEHGGTSLRDFVDGEGREGQHSHYLWVYDREGQGCMRPTCDGTIRRTVIQGRATFHCPRCQHR